MTEQPFDPQLKAAMEEIRQVCERYDVGFTGMIVSPTHSEFSLHLPTWSVAQSHRSPDGREGIRFRSHQADFDSPDAKHHADDITIHMIDQWRNWHARQLEAMLSLLDMLNQTAEITSSLDDAEPRGHDIVGEAAGIDPANQPESRQSRRRRERQERKLGKRKQAPDHSQPLTGNIIGMAWQDWAKAILTPMNIGPMHNQYIETRRAFYAGGWTTFQSCVGISDRMSEDQAMRMMTLIAGEFESFNQRIGQGGY